MSIVEIAPPDFDVDLDLAYATADNFTGAPIYRRAACYLHVEAASRLKLAIAFAGRLGYRLRIFDGFRPAEAQRVLWHHFPNPDYVADPLRGSAHSRGIALDLTLIDREGRPLVMGTGFDDFSSRAHHGASDIPIVAQHNRCLLLGTMISAGWQPIPTEWWHYQLAPVERYPVLSDTALAEPLL